ncbi:aspartate aminotransferase family protein [Stappia sp.]|uniref:aspartate aminotransferase family protein n=1 Tax=Stappia sp. TaxID=1870903 RepID=UPI003A9A1A35
MNTQDNFPNATVREALREARALYVERNPESSERHRIACDVMPGGNTRSVLFHTPFPLTIAHGKGSHVEDVDGRQYVDLLGEFTAGLFGHSNARIRAAIIRALDGGINLSGHNRLEADFAKEVCGRFPSLDLIRFTNSGTEANLFSVATACAHTGRKRILAFRGGYHGGLLSFGERQNPVNAPFEVTLCDYNDGNAVEKLLAEAGDTFAAIIVEPMLGAGGCVPADVDFLRLLESEAGRYGIVLIFDEVMTSRLGPAGLQGEYGIAPDLTTLGKYVGGGMSFGAFGGKASLMSRFDPRKPEATPHAGTFNNNILTMSAGLTAMTEIATPEALRALNDRGDRLRNQLNRLCADLDAALVFTGLGSLMTAHFTSGPVRNASDVQSSNQALRELFFFDMLERGFYMARRCMIALSLEVSEAECQRFAEAVEDFLRVRRPLLGASGAGQSAGIQANDGAATGKT